MNAQKTYMGIDLSKERLDLVALAPHQEEWSLPNGAAGFARLLAQLAQWPAVVVVCEASGG